MTLRELIIDWLTSSRYVKWLETQHQEQRQDYTERLSEKDSQIKHLRVELAGTKLECDRMRAVLMPFGSPSGSAYAQKFEITATPPVVPAFDGPDDWQAELNKMYEKEKEDGIHGEGRIQEHEPSADASA
jgi:hypothetical protein